MRSSAKTFAAHGYGPVPAELSDNDPYPESSEGELMSFTVVTILVVSSLLAAGGQLMFKMGVTGRSSLAELVNPMIFLGFGAYAAGTMLWLYGLSKAPLYSVYPFTLLTFVLVGIMSVFVLGERPTPLVMAGAAVIVAGVVLVALGTEKPV
jgi:drug/metabolite transporter (DMT)-like permease